VQIQPHPRAAILSADFARVLTQMLQRIRRDHRPHLRRLRRVNRTERFRHRADQHRERFRIDFTRHRQHARPALKILHGLLGRVAEHPVDHHVALIETKPLLREPHHFAATPAAQRLIDVQQRLISCDGNGGAADEHR